MLKLRFRRKDDISQLNSAWIREQLNTQISLLTKLNDRIFFLEKKVEELKEEILELRRKLRERGKEIRLSEKTKLAIKLIIRKHGRVTASQLSRLINLSRTRCNEYLKQMEKEGILTSKIEGKKKFYFLRS